MLVVVLAKMPFEAKVLRSCEQQQKVFYRPDASLERNIVVLTCLTVKTNAYINFLFFSIIDAAE